MLIYGELACIEGGLLCEIILTQLVSNETSFDRQYDMKKDHIGS